MGIPFVVVFVANESLLKQPWMDCCCYCCYCYNYRYCGCMPFERPDWESEQDQLEVDFAIQQKIVVVVDGGGDDDAVAVAVVAVDGHIPAPKDQDNLVVKYGLFNADFSSQ